MNTLEFLPNEILLECFRYFTALDLFHSFDHLNQRFSTLIRSVSLHLNFENVSKAQLKQFCQELQQSPSMKLNVHSLHLSYERSSLSTAIFLRSFSLVEFPSLKSLILSSFEEKNAYKIISMFPSMPDLKSFIWACDKVEGVEIPDNILWSKCTRLTIPTLGRNLRMDKQSWQMRRLTLSEVKLDQVSKIFQYAPKLINFTIRNLHWEANERVNCNGYSAVSLQQFHIEWHEGFLSIESLLQHTPNLKVLTLIASNAREMMDADRWEQLICSSLKDLKVFQFYFRCKGGFSTTSDDNLVLGLEQFESDFYAKQHQWVVRYKQDFSSLEVYTIPFVLDKYILSSMHVFSRSKSFDSKVICDRVTDLSLGYYLQGPSDYYFPNVKILKLEDNLMNADLDQHILTSETVDFLKRTVDLSKVTSLHISEWYSFESSTMMLDLLTETPNISSIGISPQMFDEISPNAPVCFVLKAMIKSFIFSSRRGSGFLLYDFDVVKKFCRTFPYLEELTCSIFHPWQLTILLRRLLNLWKIKINIFADDFNSNFPALEKYQQILQNEFHLTDDEIHFDPDNMYPLTIRIDRNIE